MEDDITFGASVWAVSEPLDAPVLKTISSSNPTSDPSYRDGAFDDFDDFGSPIETTQEVKDDDFGDFGDFGETEVGFDVVAGFTDGIPVAGPSSQRAWHSLKLDPLPSRTELENEVYDILGPIWESDNAANVTTNDIIRDVEGISQILMTSESRELHKMLLKSPPPTKPPNWTRSRIRRQHLIALGIPVNLDEVLPRVNGKPLPPLEISTRPMSAPPGPRIAHVHDTGTNHNSRSGTPQPGVNVSAQFGEKPDLDAARINKLLQLDPEMLTMQPLSTLERYLNDLKSQTANASSLLTYLLQVRDGLQQDAETYNGLIAELVGEAQKIKSGKPRTTVKRGTN